MLSICRAYFWLNRRFHDNPYFSQTLRMLRFTVLGLIASAALMLIKPANFIDTASWIIFALVAFCTILPEIAKPLVNKTTPPVRKGLVVGFSFLSHPILLIVLAGLAGYLIYR